jgi:hypothetical protein
VNENGEGDSWPQRNYEIIKEQFSLEKIPQTENGTDCIGDKVMKQLIIN